MVSRPSMTPSPSSRPPSGPPRAPSHNTQAPGQVSAVSQPPSSSLNPPTCPAPGSRAALTCPAVTCPPATWWAPATPGTCLISWLAWTGSRHVTRHQRVLFPATVRTRAPDTFPMVAPCPLTIFLLQPFLASHSPPWTYLITTTVTRYTFLLTVLY